jgi:hypothetical protein
MDRVQRTRTIFGAAAAIIAAAFGVTAPYAGARKPAKPPHPQQVTSAEGARPRIEVVFVLDTTGSMSGLIQGAKDKIWSIARHIVSAKPAPDVKIGLVAFRDIGDAYVTRAHGLTADLDQVFEHLMAFRAEGGGDTPEHVSRALHDAVHGMQWSPSAMKMIFLVGDAPPHTDYKDGYDYRAILKEAQRREIRVHAIRAGSNAETQVAWREIAKLGRGTYASIAQSGGVIATATPHDAELAELGARLGRTAIVVGDDRVRTRVSGKMLRAASAPAPAAADRAGYYATSGAALDEADVLEGAAAGAVDVEALKPQQLPAEMRAMTAEEKKAHVKTKKAEREAIMKQMSEVSAKRDAYLRDQAKGRRGDAFDEVVTEAISEQGKAYGLAY